MIRLVAVENLMDQASSGFIAEDILSPHGFLIVSRGMPVANLIPRFDKLLKSLKEASIEKIPINFEDKSFNFTPDEIVAALRGHIPTDDCISATVKKHAIETIEKTFTAFHEDQPLDVQNIENVASSLAEEVSRTRFALLGLSTVKQFDQYTYIHSLNVSILNGLIGKAMGKKDAHLRDIIIAGLLHDIGKSRVPLEILNKPDKLTNEEFGIIKKHPELGARLSLDSGLFNPDIILPILNHHERWNGTGYPEGLSGERIPLNARITAVSDVYDALTASRVYKTAIMPRNAVMHLVSESHLYFDPIIMRFFLQMLSLFPPGTVIQLDDGRVGIVLEVNHGDLMRPKISVTHGYDMKPMETPYILNLKDTHSSVTQVWGATKAIS